MNKQTKRIRRNRKNKTRKYYGGAVPEETVKNSDYVNQPNQSVESNESKGIFDIIGDKLSGYSGKAFNYVKDKGLRLAGLQPIKQPVENAATQEVDQKINEIGDAASGIIGDVKDVFDKGSAAIIENINDVLESPQVGETLTEAASETAEIGEKLLENFNEKLSTPELKEEAKIALDNAADYADIAVEALDEPINKAVDQLNEAGTKAASGAISGIVKVGTDALAAVPGAGAIIEVGKILNDGSRAVGDVATAASEATSTISKVVEETSKNINEGLDKLEEKKEGLSASMNSITPDMNLKTPDINSLTPDINLKTPDINLKTPDINLKTPDINLKPDMTLKQLNKEGGSISNRVDKSINQFENPINSAPVLTGGGKKTRR
jgi:uncharacterized protein YoxC